MIQEIHPIQQPSICAGAPCLHCQLPLADQSERWCNDVELFDLGRALEAQLYGSREQMEGHPFFAEHPLLLSRLVSKLTYCVRDAPPRYIAVDLSNVGELGSFYIALFTDDHLFHLAYDPTVDHITTTIVGRQTLSRIEVLSAPNFMAGDTPGTYSGSVKVLATYEDLKVQLPGDNQATEKNRDQLDLFLTTMFKDLLRT